jgi:hypothetical protein
MLRRYTWEKAKGKLQHYRRRTPEASVLYQILYHSRDDLQFQWESRFQHQYGCLRDEVVKTFDQYLNCGILAHRAARVHCDGCKHSLLKLRNLGGTTIGLHLGSDTYKKAIDLPILWISGWCRVRSILYL